MIARLLSHKLGLAGLLLIGVAVALLIAYNARPAGLIACACSDLAPPPSTNWLAAQAAATYYVDGTNGDDNNPGTATAPWKTVQHAIDSIASGDTVIIAAGIYRVNEIQFGPAGQGPSALTTFKAAPGARVIFTTPNDRPPPIWLTRSYLKVEGLWFGGEYQEGNQAVFFTGAGSDFESNRFHKQLTGNTFFGYHGLAAGAVENLLLQDNRFVHFGEGQYDHAVYLSGRHNDRFAQHAIVDNNIFVAGKGGYAIHGWHTFRSSILTRNFIADSSWGLVVDASDHLIANNFFWRMRGGAWAPIGAQLRAENVVFLNNVMGPGGRVTEVKMSHRIENNAFLGPAPVGAGAIVLQPGDEESAFGLSAQAIDDAIAALDAAFDRPVAEIYADSSIEAHFATLRLRIPQDSPLYEAGVDWNPFDGSGTMNVGPDVLAPAGVTQFWLAFRAQELCDWNSYGHVYCAHLQHIYMPTIVSSN